MRNKSLLLAVLLVVCTSLSAQTITHSFRNTSMADALRYLSMASHQYMINFAYDDLEDFKVTTDVRNQTVPDAIRQIIGFYPIGMKVVDGGKDAQGKPFPDLIFVECIQKESRKLTGRVVDENGQPMEFVNVGVLSPRDSSFINGGVTTAAGDFVIPCKTTDVLVSLTSVGYRRLVRHITTAHAGVLTMRPDAYQLKTVNVKGRRKVEHEDRNVYTFSDEEVKASREAQQLIATLPGLRVDVLSGQLATLSGKPLTILVNGIESNDNDLKALQAKDIRNVDYYVVPARYADAGTVLNIHTRAAENGYATGFDVMQGTKAGFNNTNVYAKYNHGPHQFSLDYRLELRNAANCDEQDTYTFKDGDKRATYDYSGTYHFGYAHHDFNLKYLFTHGDSLNFQAKFTPTIQRRNSFSPSLDLYFDRKLPGGHEIMLNAVGTLFHNKQHVHNIQNDETQQTLDDDMRQHNNKYSFIGEAAYTKDWGRTQLALGYRAALAKSDYRITNILSDYKEYDLQGIRLQCHRRQALCLCTAQRQHRQDRLPRKPWCHLYQYEQRRHTLPQTLLHARRPVLLQREERCPATSRQDVDHHAEHLQPEQQQHGDHPRTALLGQPVAEERTRQADRAHLLAQPALAQHGPDSRGAED